MWRMSNQPIEATEPEPSTDNPTEMWEHVHPILRRVVTSALERDLAQLIADEAKSSASMFGTMASMSNFGQLVSQLGLDAKNAKEAEAITSVMNGFSTQVAGSSDMTRNAMVNAFRCALAKLGA